MNNTFSSYERKGYEPPWNQWKPKQLAVPVYLGTNVLDWNFGHTPSQQSDFQADALSSFGQVVPRSVSLGNFLLELGDVKSLAETAMRLGRTASSPRKLNKLLRRSKQENARSLTRELANANLAYEFGIKPFVDDLKKISDALNRINKRIAWLKKTSGKPTTLRRTDTMTAPDTSVGSLAYFHGLGNDLRVRTTYSERTSRVVAGATVRHDLGQQTEDFHFLASALTSYFGFDRPVSVVWESLPFSFLVDWFLDIGRLADQMQLPNALRSRITVHHPWYSIKKTQKVTRSVYTDPSKNNLRLRAGIFEEEYWKADLSVYSRKLGIQGSGGLSFTTALNEDQWRNLSALALQRGV